MKYKNLLKFDWYYVFHSYLSTFKTYRFQLNKNWSFIRDIPKSVILEKFITKSDTSLKVFHFIWKYNLFFARNKLRKIVYQEDSLSSDLFNNIHPSFNGLTLNVTLLEYFPCVAIHQDGKIAKYSGSEVKLMDVISKYLNFNVHFYPPVDGKWGNLNKSTGKWSGMIQEVISSRANIAMGCIGGTDERAQVIDYSYITRRECGSFVVPKAEELPKWTILGAVFEYRVWIGIILTLVVSIICLWLLTKEVAKFLPENTENLKLLNATFSTIRMILQVSPTQHPVQTSTRFFTINMWVFTIVVSVAYKSMFTSLLSFPRFSTPLNTIEEIANSDLTTNMINYGGGYVAFFRDNPLPVINQLWKKMQFIESIPDAVAQVKESRKNAVLDSRTNLKLLIISDYTDPNTGLTLVHQITECLSAYNVALVLEKKSPYKAAIDDVTRRLVQTGFINKWNNDLILEKQFAAEKKRSSITEEENFKDHQLSMHNLQGLFMAFLIGFLISTICFITEISISCKI